MPISKVPKRTMCCITHLVKYVKEQIQGTHSITTFSQSLDNFFMPGACVLRRWLIKFMEKVRGLQHSYCIMAPSICFTIIQRMASITPTVHPYKLYDPVCPRQHHIMTASLAWLRCLNKELSQLTAGITCLRI